MDSDDELLETVMGEPSEPRSKRRRMVDLSGYEDIARELEEGAEGEGQHEGDGDTTQDEEDDPDAWLLQQYDTGPVPSESGGEEGTGMDVDLEELLDEGAEVKEGTVVKGETPSAPQKEKATYTSSGRLLVPSHKSREAKAAAPATEAVWKEMEMEMEMGIVAPVEKKKPSGSKSKSKSAGPKASASNSASGTPQPRPSTKAGGTTSKSGGSKPKVSAANAGASAAAALALATAAKAASSKSKKKGDPTKKVKEKEARSRSESRQVETPGPETQIPPKVTIVEPPEEQEEDSRLYCVCKTRYDEEKVMIACDRCDDWYHPGCVNLPEWDVDLIDQFVCPLCVIKYSVHTSYKTRCAVKGCNKPARAPVSKYCSDLCGLKSATARLQTLRARGVDLEQLWYAAKDARPPEGVVYVHLPGPAPNPPPSGVNNIGSGATRVLDGRQKADLERLERLMEESAQLKARCAALEMGIGHLKARLRLLNCAMQRNERAGGEKCGFDARIVIDDEDWAVWVEGEGKWTMEEAEGDEGKAKLLEAYEKMEGAHCTGKKRCDKHSGWQNLKFADFSAECDAKQLRLEDVTNKHQETRRKITELRNEISSLARPPAERVVPPPLPEESAISV